MAKNRWQLLGRRVTKAVQKVKFLLDFNVNRWKLASFIGGSSSKRRLSFKDDRPGLRSFIQDTDDHDHDHESSRGLQRTTSYPSEYDVDKRADAFISNFYKQLQFERQISLDVKYYRGNSFDSVKSP